MEQRRYLGKTLFSRVLKQFQSRMASCELLLVIALSAFVCLHLLFINLQGSNESPSSSLRSSKFFQTYLSVSSSSPLEQLDLLNITLQTVKNELLILKESGLQKDLQLLPSQNILSAVPIEALPEVKKKAIKRSAVIFTMDCMRSYEENSKGGGAAGELIVRHSLEEGFKRFDIPLRIIRSDEEFINCNMDGYDIILLDTWTWAAKGESLLLFPYDFFVIMVTNYRLGTETKYCWS